MQPVSRSKAIIVGVIAAVALAIAGSVFFGAKKTRDLEASARSGVAVATSGLQEALALAPDAPGAAARIEEHGKAVTQTLEALRREDHSRNRPLAEAAELYLIDVQAMLRNQANAARARAAALSSRRALAGHMSHAAGRGTGWIQNALALKQRAERDNFEYRTAIGAYAELLRVHRDTQDRVRAVFPAARLIDEALRAKAYAAAKQAEEQAAAELERIRKMAIPR